MSDKLEIKYIPLSELTKQLWKRNPKKSDLGALHESINRYGFKTAPRFEPELNGGAGGINVGNHRLIALEQMKADGKEPPRGIVAENGEWLVPVQFGVDALTETESEAFGLDDNSLGMLGGDFDMYDIAKMYDEGVYTELLKSLCDMDLPPVSMDHDDISAFLQTVENNNGTATNDDEHVGELIDKAEELNKKWQVKLGDLWECGEHRIICGDGSKQSDVEKVMGSKLVDMIVTDPPYGVSYKGGTTKRKALEGDESPSLYEPALKLAARHSKPDAPCYLWHSDSKSAAVSAAGYERRCTIIWNKNQAQFGALGAQYKTKHEPCYYLFKKGESPNWCGPTNETTVWDIDRNRINENHPTEKPLECMARPIRNHGKVGDFVYDPFLGSGTTMIACENLKRKCRAIELNPAYVAVSLQRWSDLTGKKPKLVL